MPEDLEKTIKPEEFRDLIAYLRYEDPPPEPVATARAPGIEGTGRIRVAQEYGLAIVSAVFPVSGGGAGGSPGNAVELLRYNHSGDGRPTIHPILAPGGGPALMASLELSAARGWIRSRGLESVRELADRVEIVSKSDWLTQRRGGSRLLEEV